MADDWRAQERAVDARLGELLPGIAEQLVASTGQGWWSEETERTDRFTRPNFLLHGPAEAKLRIQKGNSQDTLQRVQVIALFPTATSHYWYRDVTTSISVAESRGAEAIGREIARRLLPGYLPALYEAQRRIAQNEAEVARRHARARRIKEITGGEFLAHQQSESSSEVYLSRLLSGGGSGGIRLYGDGSSGNLELSGVPYETLLAVATLLERIKSQLRVVA